MPCLKCKRKKESNREKDIYRERERERERGREGEKMSQRPCGGDLRLYKIDFVLETY